MMNFTDTRVVFKSFDEYLRVFPSAKIYKNLKNKNPLYLFPTYDSYGSCLIGGYIWGTVAGSSIVLSDNDYLYEKRFNTRELAFSEFERLVGIAPFDINE